MSEPSPPGVAENAAQYRAEALTSEGIDSVLADFRAWLQDAADRAADAPALPSEPAEPISLHTLLSQFTALRHEIHLQTKAARGQQEQTAQALGQLGEALAALEQSEARVKQSTEQAEGEKLRPLLKALVDVADSLGLARREVQRVGAALACLLGDIALPDEAPPPPGVATPAPRSSFWERWFGTRQPERPPLALAQPARPTEKSRQATERIRQFVESLVTGYTMSMQRLERTLQQNGLEAIPCQGQPFDPELMEVVEALNGTGLPAGQVLEEVHRGYLWRGRVFRYAQVRVARS